MIETLPFETQTDLQISRQCGAACLSLIYKSFGKEIPQPEIWPQIAKPNRFGVMSSTTHLMALHALGRGLNAVAIQARHPIQVLRLCQEHRIRAILNQRSREDVSTGHYTLLVDVDDKSVVLKDPALGPLLRMSHTELLRIWLPSSPGSEITGNILIGIAVDPVPIRECEFCRTPIPAAIDCPRCRKPVSLQPAAMLGCVRDGCIARMWNYVACPSCDFLFNETGPATVEAPRKEAPSQPPPIVDLLDLHKAFAQLDKLVSHMLTIPGMADHPDLRAQLDFININKEKARLAQIAEFTAIKTRLDRLALAKQEKDRKTEERRKKVEELKAPLPPLDARVIGEALLTGLGLEAYKNRRIS
jgi:hypothetical protein